MDIESINAEILATKILNELKYNKRMFYNWPIWFRGDKEENIREVLVSEISNIKNELLKGTLNPKLKEIEAIPMYKKVKDNLESQSHNVITFSSSRKITGKIEFNYFIQLSLQDFIVSAIWVETVGKIVDNGFDSDIYANRLSVSQSSF